ncbi:DpnD/PcfM family protein [Leptotrichia sp. oral taxon 879]|uniref:DpnD/PcfM family protein n=1 Tax=Leptotrichia sp. oral taxon 879 TaxID=1227267 RepID=UPI0003AE7560|nr:DpnD/PcfM family protein [Leptotrichia sp. oral taxon 879]ERK48901.1 hypothetical protein HMPREF1552_01896 [Leptotrichia sp. oral taxon 879 str. F0557]
MKKFKIIIEKHVSEEFEVEAENIEEAFNIAEKKYYSGEFVLEPGNVSYKLMFGETVDRKESIEWIEF